MVNCKYEGCATRASYGTESKKRELVYVLPEAKQQCHRWWHLRPLEPILTMCGGAEGATPPRLSIHFPTNRSRGIIKPKNTLLSNM